MSSSSIRRDNSSTSSKGRRSTNRWWSRTKPGTTLASSPRFPRRRPRANSANTGGSSSPSIMAARIARPVTPMVFDTTEPSFTFASSGVSVTRLICELRSRVSLLRRRVGSRISGGGAKLPLSSPHSSS